MRGRCGLEIVWFTLLLLSRATFALANRGDANCDGFVDGADVASLMEAVFSGTDCAGADVNDDGAVSGADLVALNVELASGDDQPTATPESSETATAEATPTVPPPPGPRIVFFGLAAADGRRLAPRDTIDGVDIYERATGRGFRVVVEATIGASGKLAGARVFVSGGRPDLQIESSRPLGDGSAKVCDAGVPGIDPPDFGSSPAIDDTLNDLGCRFNAATNRASVCTLDDLLRNDFVNADARIQFCGLFDSFLEVPSGETRLTVQLADSEGTIGERKRIVVRVGLGPFPTSTTTPSIGRAATATVTPALTATATPPSPPPNHTSTVEPTATIQASSTPTVTPSIASSATPTGSRPPSQTATRTPTAVRTATATATTTSMRTSTPTATPSLVPSPTPTGSRPPSQTATRTPTAVRTATATATTTSMRTSTPTATPSLVPSPTPTGSPVPSRTATRTQTTARTATSSATPTSTRTPTRTATRTSTGTVTRTRPYTGTPTPTGGASGPSVTFFGIANANGTLSTPIATATNGVPIYSRVLGSGFLIVVEGRRNGTVSIGQTAFNYDPGDAQVRPALQIISSRPLGNGSSTVCDNQPPDFGGVPAVSPPSFEVTQPISDSINDLGCRFLDGTGSPGGRPSTDACVLQLSGEYRFANSQSQVQFCSTVSQALRFPRGDTLLTVRLANVNGVTGSPVQIIVRTES